MRMVFIMEKTIVFGILAMSVIYFVYRAFISWRKVVKLKHDGCCGSCKNCACAEKQKNI